MSDDGRLRVDDRMRSVMDRRFSRPAGRTEYILVGQVGGSGFRDRVPGSLTGSYMHGLIVLAIVVDAAIDRWCLNFSSLRSFQSVDCVSVSESSIDSFCFCEHRHSDNTDIFLEVLRYKRALPRAAHYGVCTFLENFTDQYTPL